MPNDQVWGLPENLVDQYADQDLVSLGNEIIDVVDINDANRVALHAQNSNTDAAARALKVEGKTEIVGDVTVDGIITANSSIQGNNAALNLETEN